MTCHVCIRTITPEARQPGDYETWIICEEILRTEVEGFEYTGSERFNEDVYVLEDGFEEGESLRRFKIEGYAELCRW